MSEATMKEAIREFMDADKKYLELIGRAGSLPGDKPIITKDGLMRIRQARGVRDGAEKKMHEAFEQQLREMK